MDTFIQKNFELGELKGISTKTVEEHIKLYNAYVKNANLVLSKIKEYENDPNANAYVINELRRRFGFEVGGVKNHEIYFSSLSGGAKTLTEESTLVNLLKQQGENIDSLISKMKSIAMTRGIGWAMLYYDKDSKKLLATWVDEQHVGHLAGLPIILALDMWEHSYYLDCIPSEKSKYVDAFFENLNWEKIEENLKMVL